MGWLPALLTGILRKPGPAERAGFLVSASQAGLGLVRLGEGPSLAPCSDVTSPCERVPGTCSIVAAVTYAGPALIPTTPSARRGLESSRAQQLGSCGSIRCYLFLAIWPHGKRQQHEQTHSAAIRHLPPPSLATRSS